MLSLKCTIKLQSTDERRYMLLRRINFYRMKVYTEGDVMKNENRMKIN